MAKPNGNRDVSQPNRTETMATKLAAYAQRHGLDPIPVLHAYQLALEPRVEILSDVFHPDMLHPARTVLILLEDAVCRDSDVLAAAALCETEYAKMRLPANVIRENFSAHVAELVTAVPLPQLPNDELLERLVTSSDDVALIAVAERLDHARHLRFRDQRCWRPFFEQIEAVYLPFAARVNERLYTRLERWRTAFLPALRMASILPKETPVTRKGF